jgi:hypothetical protein
MKLKSVILCLAALSSVSQAATINWANGGGRGHAFFLADGVTRVPAGSLIEVGFFSNPASATSTFTLFGTTTMGDPGAAPNNIGGHIPGSGRSVVSALSDGNTTYQGKQLAIRVYNSATSAGSTQLGVFTATLWTTPGDPGFNDSSDSFLMTVGVSAAPNNINPTALDPGDLWNNGSYRVGSVTVGAGSNAAGAIYQLGAAVPEPSGVMLLSFIAMGGLIRRRRYFRNGNLSDKGLWKHKPLFRCLERKIDCQMFGPVE